MDAEYARIYRDLYCRHWWWRAREHLILSTLRKHIPRHTGEAVLDVGCGDALFLPALEEFGTPTGIEPDETLVDPANSYAKRICIQAFDERFQPGCRYALITMLDVLEHLDQPERALRHVASLLQDDGLVMITVPAFPQLWTSHDDLNHHRVRYTKRSLGALAARSGLQLVERRYFFHWTCPIKLLIRWKERWTHSMSPPPCVPSAPVNRLLTWISRIEQLTLGRLSLPFGSSLLGVGRRCDATLPGQPPDVT